MLDTQRVNVERDTGGELGDYGEAGYCEEFVTFLSSLGEFWEAGNIVGF